MQLSQADSVTLPWDTITPEVEVSRGGQVHHMEFERGKTTKKLEVIGKAKGTGTLVTFKPDPEIFRRALKFMKLQPDRALHVGDDSEHDWKAATAAGLLESRVVHELERD